jgi:hypothetical protein
MLKKMIVACFLLTGFNTFASTCKDKMTINLDRISVYHNPELSEKNADYKAAKDALSARVTMFLDVELKNLTKENGVTRCQYVAKDGLTVANIEIKEKNKDLRLVFKADQSVFNVNMKFSRNAPQLETVLTFAGENGEALAVADSEISVSEND